MARGAHLDGLLIRRARLADQPAIQALQSDLDRDHAEALPDVIGVPEADDDAEFASMIANEARCFPAVAEVDGDVVGYVDASWHDAEEETGEPLRPWCRINNIAVHPAHRRRGIATALIEATERWTRERGLPDVRLDVYEFNTAALRLYERMGYGTVRRQMRKVVGRNIPR